MTRSLRLQTVFQIPTPRTKTCLLSFWFHLNVFSGLQSTRIYQVIKIQWNLHNETGKVLLKTHKFRQLPGTVFTKSCLFSLSWKTTCLERPQNLVVALYKFHFTNCVIYRLLLKPIWIAPIFCNWKWAAVESNRILDSTGPQVQLTQRRWCSVEISRQCVLICNKILQHSDSFLCIYHMFWVDISGVHCQILKDTQHQWDGIFIFTKKVQ